MGSELNNVRKATSPSMTGICVFVANETDLVTSFNQALAQLVAVSLDPTELGEGEVSANQNAILSVSLSVVVRVQETSQAVA